MKEPNRNVVVTGLGIVSSLGFNTKEYFENLCGGKDAVSIITNIDTKGFRRLYGAQIKEPLPIVKEWYKYSRASQMALLATGEALKNAGIDTTFNKSGRVAVSIGTMLGGATEIENWYCDHKEATFGKNERNLIKQYPLQAIAETIAYEYKVAGFKNTVMTACASSTTAIGLAYRWLQRGKADAVICGGADSFRAFSHLGLSAFRIISPDKIRPFDINRKGTILGEGAGILILESEENARNRGAIIYCRILGYGASCDANDLAHPDEDGFVMGYAMEKAIRESNLDKKDIIYINAHGIGGEKTDLAEANAIKRVFGGYTDNIHVSSVKGAIGHTNGAAGGIGAITTVLSIYHNMVPPTINTVNQDPRCQIKMVLNKPVNVDIKSAISNSFGFGGNNVSILFGEA